MSLIDFFVVEGNLAKAIKNVSTVLSVVPHPHRPVKCQFRPEVADLSFQVFQAPPAIPREAIIGPRPKPADWSSLQGFLEAFAGLELGLQRGPTSRRPTRPGQGLRSTSSLEPLELRSSKALDRRSPESSEGPCLMWASPKTPTPKALTDSSSGSKADVMSSLRCPARLVHPA